jgi:hypothetical protein
VATWLPPPGSYNDPKLGASPALGRSGLYHAHKLVAAELLARLGAKPGGGNWLGDPAIKIAVVENYGYSQAAVDSGEIPAIAPENRWDMETGTSAGALESSPANTHGTQCLSVIFGRPNNNLLAMGVAPDCTPMYVRVGGGTASQIITRQANAIRWAADHGADIISCSFGGLAFSGEIEAAVAYAWGLGAVVFAGAGNAGSDISSSPYLVPANAPYAVCVGAAHPTDDAPIYNYGTTIDVVGSIGRWVAGSDSLFGGTSEATPDVAGIAGLAKSMRPSISKEDLVALVRAAVDPGMHSTFAGKYPNAGVASASRAVAKALSLEHPGTIYPFVGFGGEKVTWEPGATSVRNRGSLLLDAYCTDPIADLKLYAGATIIRDGAAAAWTPFSFTEDATFRVLASTATATSDETYSDLVANYDPFLVVVSVVESGSGYNVEGVYDTITDGMPTVVLSLGGAEWEATVDWQDDGGDPVREWFGWSRFVPYSGIPQSVPDGPATLTVTATVVSGQEVATTTIDVPFRPGPRTIRVEAGGSPVLATLVPGADLGPLAGAASFAAPSLSAAPPLPTMAGAGQMAALDASATVSLPSMAGAGAMAAPEFLSPETGHRIRVVAAGAPVVVNVVPGADLGGFAGATAMAAVTLSAEVPLAAMAGAGAMAVPSLGLGLPSFAGVGTFAQPSFSAAVGLPTMAGKGAMRVITIKFPGPSEVALSRWRRPRAWVHGRHW